MVSAEGIGLGYLSASQFLLIQESILFFDVVGLLVGVYDKGKLRLAAHRFIVGQVIADHFSMYVRISLRPVSVSSCTGTVCPFSASFAPCSSSGWAFPAFRGRAEDALT